MRVCKRESLLGNLIIFIIKHNYGDVFMLGNIYVFIDQDM